MRRHVPSIAIVFLVGATLAPAARALDGDPPQCTPEGLFADVRDGMKNGSPALRRYVAKLLKEAALVLPSDLLLKELAREEDPAVIEVLGAALVVKAESAGEPKLVEAILKRAIQDSDPARRAAAVRALRGSGSVELMEANGGEIDYERLIADDAAEVRAAVVDNLVTEDKDVYSGHSQELSEAALRTAFASEDAAAAATILSRVSTEGVGIEGTRSLVRALDADDASVRAASARALGGLSPASASGTPAALVAQYRRDDDLAVRRAILESLARLERQRAIPVLESLRSIDPRLEGEIAAWIAALRLGLNEWPLIVREKSRLQS